MMPARFTSGIRSGIHSGFHSGFRQAHMGMYLLKLGVYPSFPYPIKNFCNEDRARSPWEPALCWDCRRCPPVAAASDGAHEMDDPTLCRRCNDSRTAQAAEWVDP
jgi:hypothetical protein